MRESMPVGQHTKPYEHFIYDILEIKANYAIKDTISGSSLLKSNILEEIREFLDENGKLREDQALQTKMLQSQLLQSAITFIRVLQIEISNLYVGIVNRFLTYIVENITMVFQIKPEACLNFNKQYKLSEIMKYTSMEEFIYFVADDIVHELSYKNILDLAKSINDKLGIVMGDEIIISDMAELIEIRNIHVHNRGIVNDIFLKKIQKGAKFGPYSKGSWISINSNLIAALINSILEIAKNFEDEIIKKYSPTTSHIDMQFRFDVFEKSIDAITGGSFLAVHKFNNIT